MLMMALLMVLGIGLLSLSTIELRRSQREDFAAMARANARLALTAAIGQLQTTCGPDQRVTATAELLGGSVEHDRQRRQVALVAPVEEGGLGFFADLHGLPAIDSSRPRGCKNRPVSARRGRAPPQ